MTEYLVIYEQEEGDWNAYVPDLPVCVAVGKTKTEVEKRINESIPMHIELLREYGQAVPEPRQHARPVTA
jgi:predicted RNase H-like HicB family nuclease